RARARRPPAPAVPPSGREPADATRGFLVRLLDAAEVTPEAILVELVTGGLVPQPAGVRSDLVGEQQAPLVPPELELEVHEHQIARVEIGAQDVVHAQRGS